MTAVTQIRPQVGLGAACQALRLSRATYSRWQRRAALPPVALVRRPSPSRTLSQGERAQVLAILNEERFQDQPPAQVVATLSDEGQYVSSERTMYRILAENIQVKERRDQLQHPVYKRPELLATGPNQVWSWDITKLRAWAKWEYFYLYVILDIFSRYVVGWMLADRENSSLAKRLFEETLTKQGILPGQLVIHNDRGSPMIGHPLTELLSKMDLTHSFSRPHVSDDNPYSESQFKTLKYRPTFPNRFGSFPEAQVFCRDIFPWYNNQHHHSGIQYLTPANVHYGQAETILDARHVTMMRAFENHPERFVKGPPKRQQLPPAVWINPPKNATPEANAM